MLHVRSFVNIAKEQFVSHESLNGFDEKTREIFSAAFSYLPDQPGIVSEAIEHFIGAVEVLRVRLIEKQKRRVLDKYLRNIRAHGGNFRIGTRRQLFARRDTAGDGLFESGQKLFGFAEVLKALEMIDAPRKARQLTKKLEKLTKMYKQDNKRVKKKVKEREE